MGGDGFRILLEEDGIKLKNKNRSFLIEIDPKIKNNLLGCLCLIENENCFSQIFCEHKLILFRAIFDQSEVDFWVQTFDRILISRIIFIKVGNFF